MYPNNKVCLLIDELVTPFIMRKVILENPKLYDDYERAHAKLPLDIFAEIVYAKSLLNTSVFYDIWEFAKDNDEVHYTSAFSGVFTPISQKAEFQVKFKADIDLVCMLELKKQPKLLEKNYESTDEIIEEIKSYFNAHNIEMPDDFPWLDHIGELIGVLVYD